MPSPPSLPRPTAQSRERAQVGRLALQLLLVLPAGCVIHNVVYLERLVHLLVSARPSYY